jgi:hypothetical protein
MAGMLAGIGWHAMGRHAWDRGMLAGIGWHATGRHAQGRHAGGHAMAGMHQSARIRFSGIPLYRGIDPRMPPMHGRQLGRQLGIKASFRFLQCVQEYHLTSLVADPIITTSQRNTEGINHEANDHQWHVH